MTRWLARRRPPRPEPAWGGAPPDRRAWAAGWPASRQSP